MADTDKKLSVGEIIFRLIILGLCLLFIFGCASQSKKMSQMDNAGYIAQVAQVQPQGYPCPYGGHFIPPTTEISENIRVENACPNCGKVFFGKPVAVVKKAKTANYQRGYAPYGPYGPRNYGPTSVYQSDVSHQHFGVGGYSFKETPTGFSELSWHFNDRKTKSYRVTPRWTTTRYHLVGR